MANEASEHGFVTSTCEAYSRYVRLAEGGKVVAIDDFVFGVVGEVGFEVGETGKGIVDGLCGIVYEVESFFCWRRAVCCFCCHIGVAALCTVLWDVVLGAFRERRAMRQALSEV